MLSRKVVPFGCVVLLAANCGSSEELPLPVDTDFDLIPFSERFESGSVIGSPRIVECTLSEGTTTACVAVTLPANPETFDVGPWCPTNIADAADLGGIWPEGGAVYDVDGSFIENLSSFYIDATWQMYDPGTGAVNVTDSQESCAAAARPDVDPLYTNFCVQCLTEYVEEGLTNTYVIPITPVATAQIAPRVSAGGVGVAYSGVRLDAPAPTDAILGAYTLAPFDDCGGHVNLNVGYHIHAVTDCLLGRPTTSTHSAELGIALDGYSLYAHSNLDGSEPQDLDACGGHTTFDEGYHYHVGSAGSNEILGCHTGETGCVLTDPDAACDASVTLPPPGGGPPGGAPPRGGPPPNRVPRDRQ